MFLMMMFTDVHRWRCLCFYVHRAAISSFLFLVGCDKKITLAINTTGLWEIYFVPSAVCCTAAAPDTHERHGTHENHSPLKHENSLIRR